LARQYWAGFEGGRIHDLVLGPTGQAQAVIASRQGSVNVADLVTFSLDFGESLLRLPLNITVSPGTGFSLHLTPLPGGELLAWDESGAAAIASEASHIPGPRISVDTDYPPVNGALKVEVSHGDANPDVELFLAWGEGRLEKVHDGARVESTYDRLGKATIRLTALYPSGTTSTATYVVDVGGKPDEPNNLFDYLFAAERQNYTFFGLGLLLSLIGVLLGLLARYKGRNRMEKEFGLLDKVREEGRPDAFAAIRHLHDYRLHLRDFLSRGKLEEPQYTVLVAAANGVLELLRQRILGAFLGRVSAHFSHTLDLALQDGTIDEGEARNLLGQAHKEAKLTSDERKRLELMVRSWQKSIGKPV
jgi:hypothetical protein